MKTFIKDYVNIQRSPSFLLTKEIEISAYFLSFLAIFMHVLIGKMYPVQFILLSRFTSLEILSNLYKVLN